jgi:hypothetical protein
MDLLSVLEQIAKSGRPPSVIAEEDVEGEADEAVPRELDGR